jgi:ABC-type bacteriocin/lantibiotic exporter with double-glycine peptidase domain
MSSFREIRGATGDAGSGRGRRRGEPPSLMDPERKRDPHRILALFAPYRVRLAAVMGLIVFASVLGIISPFLLKAVHDTALPTATARC